MNIVDHFDSVLSLSEGAVPFCSGCMKQVDGDKLMSCSACFKAKYCSRECQKKHWKIHKQVCKNAKTKLRFNVGDRVRISVGGEYWDYWKKGMIIGLYIHDKCLYSIFCDDGAFHDAPVDSDCCIQKLNDEALVLCGQDGKPLTKDGKPLTPIPEPPSPAQVHAAEVRDAVLFKEAPPEDDCPICGLRFPIKSETMYSECEIIVCP